MHFCLTTSLSIYILFLIWGHYIHLCCLGYLYGSSDVVFVYVQTRPFQHLIKVGLELIGFMSWIQNPKRMKDWLAVELIKQLLQIIFPRATQPGILRVCTGRSEVNVVTHVWQNTGRWAWCIRTDLNHKRYWLNTWLLILYFCITTWCQFGLKVFLWWTWRQHSMMSRALGKLLKQQWIKGIIWRNVLRKIDA